MRDDRNPTLPPPHVLRAFPQRLDGIIIHPHLTGSALAELSRQIGARIAAEVASCPRGAGAPPPDILYALRRPRMMQRIDLMSPGRERAYWARMAEAENPQLYQQRLRRLMEARGAEIHLGDFDTNGYDPETGAYLLF
jgi:hypothetical protein